MRYLSPLKFTKKNTTKTHSHGLIQSLQHFITILQMDKEFGKLLEPRLPKWFRKNTKSQDTASTIVGKEGTEAEDEEDRAPIYFILKVFLEGLYDENCNLSKLRGCDHILQTIWSDVRSYYFSTRFISTIDLPDGRRCYYLSHFHTEESILKKEEERRIRNKKKANMHKLTYLK